jgi:hypothetical protein
MFRSPGLEARDLSWRKDRKPSERVKIRFRAEFFNVLNQPNFANPYGASFTYGRADPSNPAQLVARARRSTCPMPIL